MEFLESIKAVGIYKFEAYNAKTLERIPRLDMTYKNILVQGFFTTVFEFLDQAISAPNVADLNLSHFATGTGTTTPMKSDTSLETEYFRKAISVKSFGSTSFVCKTVLGPTESNTTIREVGIFANGSLTPDSGTLISHCPTNIEKISNIQYIVTYTLTLE